MEETRWLTVEKIIAITILFIIITIIVSFSTVKRISYKKEFIKFENTINLATHNYVTREKIKLVKDDFVEINIKDVIKRKIVFNTKHSSMCKGYVIAETDLYNETKYTTYITCGKYYTTENYGYRPPSKIEKDTAKPKITFKNSSAYQTICVGNSVNISQTGPYAYIATDEEDGNITNRVAITGNTGIINTPGNYKIYYSVSDNAGNITYETRTFTVKSCN